MPLLHKGGMDDLRNKSISELLVLHASIMEELRARDVLRSANNPTGDLAEYLFCKAFGWTQAPKSAKAFDAIDIDGKRYQIKGNRLDQPNKSRQMSAIRDLNGFDVLAGVLFDWNYKVIRAALIPLNVVRDRSTFTAHTNSYRFLLRDDVWDDIGVEDMTVQLRKVQD